MIVSCCAKTKIGEGRGKKIKRLIKIVATQIERKEVGKMIEFLLKIRTERKRSEGRREAV